MRIVLILGHPDKKSFNHAIAQTVVKALRNSGHDVFFHDLYAEKFPPILPYPELPKEAHLPSIISVHAEEIVAADGIVVIHPNWWGQPPAVMKGWIDRVIRPGVAYEFEEGDSGEGMPRGLLRAKAAIVFTTSNTRRERENAVFGDPLETIWKNCVFGLCGIDNFYRRNFEVIVTSTPAQRQQWLEEVRDITNKYFPR